MAPLSDRLGLKISDVVHAATVRKILFKARLNDYDPYSIVREITKHEDALSPADFKRIIDDVAKNSPSAMIKILREFSETRLLPKEDYIRYLESFALDERNLLRINDSDREFLVSELLAFGRYEQAMETFRKILRHVKRINLSTLWWHTVVDLLREAAESGDENGIRRILGFAIQNFGDSADLNNLLFHFSFTASPRAAANLFKVYAETRMNLPLVAVDNILERALEFYESRGRHGLRTALSLFQDVTDYELGEMFERHALRIWSPQMLVEEIRQLIEKNPELKDPARSVVLHILGEALLSAPVSFTERFVMAHADLLPKHHLRTILKTVFTAHLHSGDYSAVYRILSFARDVDRDAFRTLFSKFVADTLEEGRADVVEDLFKRMSKQIGDSNALNYLFEHMLQYSAQLSRKQLHELGTMIKRHLGDNAFKSALPGMLAVLVANDHTDDALALVSKYKSVLPGLLRVLVANDYVDDAFTLILKLRHPLRKDEWAVLQKSIEDILPPEFYSILRNEKHLDRLGVSLFDAVAAARALHSIHVGNSFDVRGNRTDSFPSAVEELLRNGRFSKGTALLLALALHDIDKRFPGIHIERELPARQAIISKILAPHNATSSEIMDQPILRKLARLYGHYLGTDLHDLTVALRDSVIRAQVNQVMDERDRDYFHNHTPTTPKEAREYIKKAKEIYERTKDPSAYLTYVLSRVFDKNTSRSALAHIVALNASLRKGGFEREAHEIIHNHKDIIEKALRGDNEAVSQLRTLVNLARLRELLAEKDPHLLRELNLHSKEAINISTWQKILERSKHDTRLKDYISTVTALPISGISLEANTKWSLDKLVRMRKFEKENVGAYEALIHAVQTGRVADEHLQKLKKMPTHKIFDSVLKILYADGAIDEKKYRKIVNKLRNTPAKDLPKAFQSVDHDIRDILQAHYYTPFTLFGNPHETPKTPVETFVERALDELHERISAHNATLALQMTRPQARENLWKNVHKLNRIPPDVEHPLQLLREIPTVRRSEPLTPARVFEKK